MQRVQPQRQSTLIAPESLQRHSQALLEHPGVEQAPRTGRTPLDFSKDKVHVHPHVLYFPLGIAVVLAQDEHDRRHSRVLNSSSTDSEYKDDMSSPRARPRQSSSADKLFATRRSTATTPDRSSSPPEAHDDTDGDPIGAGERTRLRQGLFAQGALFEEKLWLSVWSRPLSQSGSQSNSNSRGVQLSPGLNDDNALR